MTLQYVCRDPEPDQKLQDLVNKTMWKKCCFSGDGEFVCAGSARQHALYVWEKSMGNLVKILHGTKGKKPKLGTFVSRIEYTLICFSSQR